MRFFPAYSPCHVEPKAKHLAYEYYISFDTQILRFAQNDKKGIAQNDNVICHVEPKAKHLAYEGCFSFVARILHFVQDDTMGIRDDKRALCFSFLHFQFQILI